MPVRFMLAKQLDGRVDPASVLAGIHTTTTNHDIKVLLNMSRPARDTPRPFQPPITQRDIKTEVAHCVGGVLRPR